MKKINWLILLIFAPIIWACNNNSNSTTTTDKKVDTNVTDSTSKGLQVNDVAPDFTLINVDGQSLHFYDYIKEQKGAIVIFTCNHCPYSIKYEDRIIALDNKFRSLGFPVIAINPNDPEVEPKDSYELMKVRAQEKSFPYPYLFDEGQKVYPQYGATRTPHVFLVHNDNGQAIVKYIGAIDDNTDDASAVKEKFVENAIESLMKSEPVAKDFTKAIGCSIKKK